MGCPPWARLPVSWRRQSAGPEVPLPWAPGDLGFLAQQQESESRAPELPPRCTQKTQSFLEVGHTQHCGSVCGNQDNSALAAEGNRPYLRGQDPCGFTSALPSPWRGSGKSAQVASEAKWEPRLPEGPSLFMSQRRRSLWAFPPPAGRLLGVEAAGLHGLLNSCRTVCLPGASWKAQRPQGRSVGLDMPNHSCFHFTGAPAPFEPLGKAHSMAFLGLCYIKVSP